MPLQSKPSTKQRVRAAALHLFSRQGYEATTLSQLADEVGIQKPSLYNHIDSKESLFMSIVDDVESAFFAELDVSVAQHQDGDVEQRLYGLVTDLSRFIFFEAQGAFYKRYLLFPPEPLAEEIRAINARSEARIDETLTLLFAHGVEEARWNTLSERQFLDMFYCLMDGLYSERFLYPRAEYERRLASIWPIYWAGLLA